MSFPPTSGIPIELSPATPTPFDVASLKTQLEDVGLSCAELSQDNLQSYIDDVNNDLPQLGKVQSYLITAPSNGSPPAQQLDARGKPVDVTSLAAVLPAVEEVATGNWTVSGGAQGFNQNLEIIQSDKHFQWLYDNRGNNGFTGVIEQPRTSTGNFRNADTIKKLFVKVGVAASDTLIKGLDLPTMQAMFTKAIPPVIMDPLPQNYDKPGSLTVFLVEDYDPTTCIAQGVGVLTVSWTLKITDWLRKTKRGGETHPTSLQVQARAVLYQKPTALCRDYCAVVAQFGLAKTAPPCDGAPCPPAHQS